MTESTETAVPPKAPKLFDALRIDPKKVSEGVWLQHPTTKDRFLRRRMWCAEHSRAYLQAAADYEKQHGEGSSATPEGQNLVEAIAMATGVIVNWRIHNDPDRPYDAAAMTAALLDPELVELRRWLELHVEIRHDFRPDNASGN